MLNSFSRAYLPSLVRCLFMSFAHFLIGFFFLYCLLRVLCIFYILSDMWLTNIFSKYIVYSLSFILLIEYSAEQKFLIPKKPNLLIFKVDSAFSVKSKNTLPNPRSRIFSLIFSKSFVVLTFYI